MQKSLQQLKKLFQAYPYHIVEASPWPILMSFSVGSMMIGAVLYFNYIPFGGLYLTLGALCTTWVFYFWFTDIITEGTYLGDHTLTVQKGLTIGVSFFILTEAFFFLTIFWAYFHSSLAPTPELGSVWPPRGIEALNPFAVPLLNTALLLSSGAAVTLGHHAFIMLKRQISLNGTLLCIILAVLFTRCQRIEYDTAGFTIADGVYGSCFYFGTGFHGFHVIIGTIFIGVAFYRIWSYQMTNTHHTGLETSILYWHFVDVVWLFLYISVYWWGS